MGLVTALLVVNRSLFVGKSDSLIAHFFLLALVLSFLPHPPRMVIVRSFLRLSSVRYAARKASRT